MDKTRKIVLNINYVTEYLSSFVEGKDTPYDVDTLVDELDKPIYAKYSDTPKVSKM